MDFVNVLVMINGVNLSIYYMYAFLSIQRSLEVAMKKYTAVLLVGVITLVFLVGVVAAAFPASTNDENRSLGWAHVNEVGVDIGEVTLEFVSTRGFFSCFEYRTDGDTSQAISDTHYNPDRVGLYPTFAKIITVERTIARKRVCRNSHGFVAKKMNASIGRLLMFYPMPKPKKIARTAVGKRTASIIKDCVSNI